MPPWTGAETRAPAGGRADVLHVHRASRADGLADGLADLLRLPAGDPFAPEVVAVPTRGVERWLSQRLSLTLGCSPGRSDGVCANVEFPFPGTLVGQALSVATGVDPRSDPWSPDRAVWPLMGVVEEGWGEGFLATLAAHLGAGTDDLDGARRARRFAMVRHLADLFDHYAVHRPAMLRAWAATGGTEGTGATAAGGA
ncbi:MAG: exodeoxyribonuclease V subunit gamma, partial [Acidimicrobiales bacterium]